ncbi:hypothetical protein E8E14_003071 [Neopestalotiopsis sp. 37M]|nr:hypothetical protein E8E14_003071 [Neopestalotiopsis sp. 37M]
MTRLTARVRKDYKRDSWDVNQGSSGVPSLPPLRSITDGNRRSAALAAFQTHTGSRYGWRRAERLIERHLASDDVPESGMRRTRTPQSARDYQHLQTMRTLLESVDDSNDELRALLDFATPPPHAYSDQLAFPSPPMQARESNDDLSDNTNELRSSLDIAQPPINLGEANQNNFGNAKARAPQRSDHRGLEQDQQNMDQPPREPQYVRVRVANACDSCKIRKAR